MADKKYELALSFKITDSENTVMSDGVFAWKDMNYENLVMLEKTVLGAVAQSTFALGDAAVELKKQQGKK